MNVLHYYHTNRSAVLAGTTGLLYVVGWALGSVAGYGGASAIVLVLAALIGGSDVATKAYHGLRSGSVGIDALVTLAATGAILIGEYWEAAAVVFLFSLGTYLEARTMSKTRDALRELLELAPSTAIVRRDGEEIEIPAADVAEGDLVVVRPGAAIPVDGVVVEGESAVDQAPVTGESAPVHKAAEDEVYAGTVNREGALEVRATGTGTDTTLRRIIRRVEEAQEAEAPAESLVERFARYYTPAIVALAVGAYAYTGNALMALTLLVIGCPGALVIGPPVSVVSAIGSAARNGVLLKGGEHLERIGNVDLVAFDKTGTLTRGEPAVSSVEGFDYDAEAALRLAAIAEKKSEHHLAGAILEAARGSNDHDGVATDGGVVAEPAAESPGAPRRPIPDPDDLAVVPGKGVVARHDGREIVVGNRALLEERGVAVPDAVAAHVRDREAAGETAVHVALDGRVVGVVGVRDERRENAADAVSALQELGVRTVMLTGDNERAARAVAEEVGIDEYRAGLLPEEKQAALEGFRDDGRVVAMVGDGINDAPGLATADVGVAMGAAGTDTAIETADVALLADDVERIPYAVGLSGATRWNVGENVAIAVGVVALLLAGVLTNQVHLAGGMLVHQGSVLLVILNGMRLLRY